MITSIKAMECAFQPNGLSMNIKRWNKKSEFFQQVKKADYPVPELKINIPFIHGLIAKQGFHFAKPIRKTLIKAVTWADIIQIETPFPVSWQAAKLAKKQGKPVIGTFHIYPQNVTASVPFLNNRLGNWCFMLFFREKSFKNCDALQVPTAKVAKWLKQLHFKQKLFVVSNGISDKFINNSHKDKVGHPFTIYASADFHMRKNKRLYSKQCN